MTALMDMIKLWFVRLDARDQRGASLVEYALLLALIALVAIVAVTYLGDTTSSSISEAGSLVADA